MAGKVVRQLAGSGSGQSLMDRMTAAKHSLAGSGLAKAVCKATTEEILCPKKKHVDYLVQCTNEANVSIPELAKEVLDRLQHPNWVVVFKSLITLHNLMNFGNERFTQYLASNNCNITLHDFSDKTTVQSHDMSTFIRRYSSYLQEKALSYRLMAFDFCKIKRGRDDSVMRTMSVEKILKALPVLISQFDALLAFDAVSNDLTNGVINASFLLLYKDASRLFVVFNDGIINLLQKFFDSMNKKQCRDALDIYKKFLIRSDKLNDFSRIAEYVGVDKSDITHLEKHPSSFLEAMEAHLAHMEGRKYTPTRSASQSSLGSATSPVAPAADHQRSQILDEEKRRLEQLKADQQRKQGGGAGAAAAAPPPARPPAPSPGVQRAPPARPEQPKMPPQPKQESNTSLLDFDQGQPHGQAQPQFANFAQSSSAAPPSADLLSAFMANQVTALSSSSGFDPFGGVLQPTPQQPAAPVAGGPPPRPQPPAKPISSDLDASLANLAGSLSVKGSQPFVKQELNWGGSSGPPARTAGPARPVAVAPGPSVNWKPTPPAVPNPFEYYPTTTNSYNMYNQPQAYPLGQPVFPAPYYQMSNYSNYNAQNPWSTPVVSPPAQHPKTDPFGA